MIIKARISNVRFGNLEGDDLSVSFHVEGDGFEDEISFALFKKHNLEPQMMITNVQRLFTMLQLFGKSSFSGLDGEHAMVMVRRIVMKTSGRVLTVQPIAIINSAERGRWIPLADFEQELLVDGKNLSDNDLFI